VSAHPSQRALNRRKKPYPGAVRAPPTLVSKSLNTVDLQAAEYVLALRQPYEAYQRGATPAYPDPEGIQPLYRWSTRMEGDANSVTNAHYSREEIWLRANRFGIVHLDEAVTFDPATGLPLTFTGFGDTSYNSWATTLFKVRMVAMEMRITNSSAVLNQAGTAMMGIFPTQYTNTKTPNQLMQMPGTNVRTLADPGSIGRYAWKPAEDMDNGDILLVDYNSGVATFPYSTSILFYGWGPATFAVHYEIITFWEASPLMEAADFVQPVLKAPSVEATRRMLYNSVMIDGDGSTSENVVRDDGPDEPFIRDVQEIAGQIGKGIKAGKDLFEAAKGVIAPATSLFSWIGSLFGHERVGRVLSILNDDDLDVLRTVLAGSRSRQEIVMKLSTFAPPEEFECKEPTRDFARRYKC